MSLTTTDLSTVWGRVLELVKEELSEAAFKTWFAHTHPLDLTDDGVFVVGAQNEFARSWLEERYSQRLSVALRQVVGTDLSVKIVLDGSISPAVDEDLFTEPAPQQESVIEGPAPRNNDKNEFSAKYTFESFVVGDSNQFARNAAIAVAEQPGLKYNPLFIWGGPGLGKTHLLHAIGQYVRQNFPHKKVLYVTSEQFLNDYVDSINSKSVNSFRAKYRTVDLLLIDDVQFLEKKEGLQEQFFNTFNDLHLRGKAVVLASDRSPKDINMEERYRSRFAAGLQADIQPPNFETRLAILGQFVSIEQIPFEEEALEYLAERSTSNIREMEGAAIRAGAFRHLSHKPVVDRSMVEQVARDLFPEHSHRPIAVSVIQREVCRFYGISHADLIGSKRSQPIVYPRQIAMYLSRELTDLSLPSIGREFGGRDHTTVMHAQSKIQKMMSQQRDVYNQIQTLTNVIKQKS